MIQFEALENGAAVTDRFAYMVCTGLLSKNTLAEISQDFPAIEQPGVFPLSELSYGPAFADLIDDICSKEMEALPARKFDIRLDPCRAHHSSSLQCVNVNRKSYSVPLASRASSVIWPPKPAYLPVPPVTASTESPAS